MSENKDNGSGSWEKLDIVATLVMLVLIWLALCGIEMQLARILEALQ